MPRRNHFIIRYPVPGINAEKPLPFYSSKSLAPNIPFSIVKPGRRDGKINFCKTGAGEREENCENTRKTEGMGHKAEKHLKKIWEKELTYATIYATILTAKGTIYWNYSGK